jgi:hypothetical protein
MASGGTKLCVPTAGNTAVVTPTSGACKAGFTPAELGAEGKEGKAGKEGSAGKEGKEGTFAGLTTEDKEKLLSVLPYVKFVKEGVDKKPTVQISGINLQVRKRRTTGMEMRMKGSCTIRSSESGCPRVMRWRSVRAQRSVDRGARRLAIEPRNQIVWGCRRRSLRRKATPRAAFSRAVSGPLGVREPVHVCDLSIAENRESPFLPGLVDDAPPFVDRGVACRRVAGRAGKAKVVIP